MSEFGSVAVGDTTDRKERGRDRGIAASGVANRTIISVPSDRSGLVDVPEDHE